MYESTNQNQIRLSAAKQGVTLWRNNNGAFEDKNGRWVRYGLANESKKISKHIKSSDLIGVKPVIVTPEMIGKIIGVFTAVEVKSSNWRYNPNDERTIAQQNYINVVWQNGGLGGFAWDDASLNKILYGKV